MTGLRDGASQASESKLPTPDCKDDVDILNDRATVRERMDAGPLHSNKRVHEILFIGACSFQHRTLGFINVSVLVSLKVKPKTQTIFVVNAFFVPSSLNTSAGTENAPQK